MKVLLVHNQYQQPGGEDAVVQNEFELLKQNGIDASLYLVKNDSIKTLHNKISTAIHVSYSPSALKKLAQIIDDKKPDIVHIHNFFPLLTPSIYDACRSARVPVVQSLHNFRTLCANGILMRDQKPCEICIKQSAYQSVRYGCYRNSRLATLPVAHMIQTHRTLGTWQKSVDQFIALSSFARDKFLEAGFPKDKISIKPNFSKDPYDNAPAPAEKINKGYALYMGRLSAEKGVANLVRAWSKIKFPLYIAGTGPLLDQLTKEKNDHIRFLGHVEAEQKAQLLSEASFLVLPSECYEGFPVVVAEAFSYGLPILASDIGSLKELISPKITGLHFTPGDSNSLIVGANAMIDSPDLIKSMNRHCRSSYEKLYSPQVSFKKLNAIYQSTRESYL